MKTKLCGCNIEYSTPKVEKIQGYNNEQGWSKEECLEPIYLDPETFEVTD